MKVSIAQRQRPFSHVPGTTCLLPRTCFVVQAFPALIRIPHLFELPLDVHGPVREFSIQQDLERGEVAIWGIAKEGRFQMRLHATEKAVEVLFERAGKQKVSMSYPHSRSIRTPVAPLERLSLGAHRAQDWTLVIRRFDQREMLPILFHLSQWLPLEINSVRTKMFDLIEKDFESFLRAGFSGIFTPRLVDEEYLGILPREEIPMQANPCALIQEAGNKIRSWFFQQNKNHLHFLPSSPFEVGRMTDLLIEGVGSVDFEWRRKTLKRVVLHADRDTEIFIWDAKPYTSFRVRTSRQEKGFRVQQSKAFPVKGGTTYFVDRFE